MISMLDDAKHISKIDKSGMLACIENSPQQIIEAAKVTPTINLKKEFDGIIFSGMGGSAISADILSEVFYDEIIKCIHVNRGYSLPSYLGENNVFIAISYSGGTEETLAALKEAETRGMQIICISSGGKLKEIAASKRYPFIELPSGFQPRAAFYSIFTTLVKVLESLGVVGNQSPGLTEAIRIIEQLKTEIGVSKPERANDAKLLAQKLKGKVPLIFASSDITESVGLRLKNQFNENAKIPAFLTVYPELNHNEIVGFSTLKKGHHDFVMIHMRDEEENLRVVKRIEITKSLIGPNLGGALEIKSLGESRLARLLSLVFFSDMLTCYYAILSSVDPTPVDIITKLKKEIKR